jgi:hypothetical protein
MPSKPSPAHLFALTSLWAPALLAQNFAEADRSALPRVPAEAVDFWVTDLDLDGHEDLVVRSLGALALTVPNAPAQPLPKFCTCCWYGSAPRVSIRPLPIWVATPVLGSIS